MRPIFFLREALRALRRNAAPSLAAVATVLITTLVLGVFIPVVRAATAKTNEVRNKIELEVFINDDATKAEVDELGNMIRDIRHVESTQFISKAEALRILKRRLGDKSSITEDLPGNPLPRSYRIKLDDPQNVGRRARAALRRSVPTARRGRSAPRSRTSRIARTTRRRSCRPPARSKSCSRALAGLLVLASVLLVANTIRLSIFARRREVEVMRLVGATNWFIRWPFVIEGLIVGFVGGAVAISLLWVVKVTVVDQWSDRFALIAAPDTIRFTLLVIILLGTATAVSAVGSGITLRRFLKV